METTPPALREEVKALRLQLAQGQLEAVLDRLLVLTEARPDLHKEAVLLSSRYRDVRQDERTGTEDYDDLARSQLRISAAALDLLDALPEERKDLPSGKPAKPRGLSEHTLKLHLLLLLLGAKVLLIGRLFVEWEAGGFSTDQFISTLTLLIPIFATYTGLMVKDLVQRRHFDLPAAGPVPQVRRSFQWTSYALCLVYFLVLWVVIGLKPRGILDFKQMTGLLATVESALGIYIGTIIFALFKKEDA